MEEAKLVKSKSSHPSVPDKERMEKSKSDAALKFALVKKRGVYVEKQEMEDPPRPKAPRRSRPGTKTFLASVLTILSKTTTGTQYPPEMPDETTEPKTPKKPTHRLNTAKQNSKIFKNPTLSKTDFKNVKNTESVKKPKKQKFRSRVLNAINNEDPDKTLVLKCKQDIVQTPSNYSKSTKGNVSNQSIKWADFLPKLIDSETGTVKTPQKNLQQIDERVAKCVQEGTQLNMQKESNEPTTLVSAPEKDEKLYNIFVNLLETVYNDKPEEDAASSVKSAKSSKVHFEMEDTVANKLYEPLENRENFDVASKFSKRCYPSKYVDKFERNKQQLGEYYFTSMPLTVKWSEQKIRQTKPVRNVKKSKQETRYQTQSEVMPRRYHKKNKKKDLLNVLKQELSVDRSDIDEPDSFFQALRVMAENKRRNQKSIHFDVPASDDDGVYDKGCSLKRRKVISPSKKNPKPYREQRDYTRDISPERIYQVEPAMHCYSNNGSVYSLEVFGYDYDEKKPGTFSDLSDVETVDEGMNRINDWNRGFKTITQVWKQ